MRPPARAASKASTSFVACVPLLSLLFFEKLEDMPSFVFVGHGLEEVTEVLDVPASDELVHHDALPEESAAPKNYAQMSGKSRELPRK